MDLNNISGEGFTNPEMMPTYDGMEFSKKLKILAGKHRFSQAVLAREIGVSQNLVSLWSRGASIPNLSDALKLARLFGVDVNYLADDSLDTPEPSEVRDDERLILESYRSLKRTGAIDADTALTGLALAAQARAVMQPVHDAINEGVKSGKWLGEESGPPKSLRQRPVEQQSRDSVRDSTEEATRKSTKPEPPPMGGVLPEAGGVVQDLTESDLIRERQERQREREAARARGKEKREPRESRGGDRQSGKKGSEGA